MLIFLSFMNTFSEAAVRRCSSKYVFLKVSQISQENTIIGVSFYKTCRLKVCNFVQKRLQQRYFPVKFAKLLRTPPVVASVFFKKVIKQLFRNLVMTYK